jgi:uncharacterized tellurite resistance protein B-like protein
MFSNLKSIFSVPEGELAKVNTVDLTLAFCVLLLETARADEEFSDEEHDRVVTVLKSRFSLSNEESEELINLASRAREESLDLWGFTNRINKTYDREARRRILKEIWRIVYADGTLDAHEDYLVRKLTHLLRLSHRDMIDAKVSVLKEVRGS